MSPLRIEAYRGDTSEWVSVGEVKPTDPPGTMSNNLPDGRREIYHFSCASDDSNSVIRKLPFGIDIANDQQRIISESQIERAEVEATLKKGGEPYKISIKTDKNPQRIIFRFTHT